jgi:outer membrane protein OmpA-like peptidoglycan-associated protein
MRISVPAVVVAVAMFLSAQASFGKIERHKQHDFIPKVHNIIFIMDVSDSMMAGHPNNSDWSRLFIASRAFRLFNLVMPHVPTWQYDLNSALITFGDCNRPTMLGTLGPWQRVKYDPYYPKFRKEGFGPWRTAGLQEALQLAGSLVSTAAGRSAVVVFSDGGSEGECPQRTATALNEHFGDKVKVFGIWLGNKEVGWRNLYESCKLTGGYVRAWEEVRSEEEMKAFAYDILVQEVMFPYTEIFFQPKSATLIPSEAMKLEQVANFLHAIPQYTLQIDGHTDFFGDTESNYKIALERAKNVKQALVDVFDVAPNRVLVRSWGEELPRYDNQNPEYRMKNRQANIYLRLPLRNRTYNEKNLFTHGTKAVGDLYITKERFGDTEWAWPDKPPPHSKRGVAGAPMLK